MIYVDQWISKKKCSPVHLSPTSHLEAHNFYIKHERNSICWDIWDILAIFGFICASIFPKITNETCFLILKKTILVENLCYRKLVRTDRWLRKPFKYLLIISGYKILHSPKNNSLCRKLVVTDRLLLSFCLCLYLFFVSL